MENRPARTFLGIAPFFLFLFAGLILAVAAPLAAQAPGEPTSPTFSFGGMVAATSQGGFDPFWPTVSLRAVPKLGFSLPAGRGWTFGGEASLDAYGALPLAGGESPHLTTRLEPYRAWLRLSGARFEARLGLQRLSFGSAVLFRPLMWFDSLDPRDPLQLTDGVYGLLLRAYAKGDANAWVWGLLGNGERRGFDLVPPDKKALEFGGRVEIPLFTGKIAATYDRRKAEIDGLTPVMSPLASPTPGLPAPNPAPPTLQPLSSSVDSPFVPSPRDPSPPLPWFILRRAPDSPSDPGLFLPPDGVSPLPVRAVAEDRFGLDGKWDLGAGVGVWFEAALVHQRTALLPLPYQRAYTLGADHTFALGRGLHVLAEHFRIDWSDRAFAAGRGLTFTALSLRYPLGVRDEISGIFYYDWPDHGLYRFVGWTHRTHAITFSAIAFWDPEEIFFFQGLAGSGSFAGTGFEIILAYNF
jgi:hypothetical protein